MVLVLDVKASLCRSALCKWVMHRSSFISLSLVTCVIAIDPPPAGLGGGSLHACLIQYESPLMWNFNVFLYPNL